MENPQGSTFQILDLAYYDAYEEIGHHIQKERGVHAGLHRADYGVNS